MPIISRPPSSDGRVSQHRSRSAQRTASPPAIPCAYRPRAARERLSRLGPLHRDSAAVRRPRRDVATVSPRGHSRSRRRAASHTRRAFGAHGRFHAARLRPFDPKPAPALLGRAGSHAGGLPARAATLFRVLRPMRCAREQCEKLTSGDFYNHVRLRFLPCRHARAACDSRIARHATGAGLRV